MWVYVGHFISTPSLSQGRKEEEETQMSSAQLPESYREHPSHADSIQTQNTAGLPEASCPRFPFRAVVQPFKVTAMLASVNLDQLCLGRNVTVSEAIPSVLTGR